MQNLQILLICEEILDLHDKRIGRIFWLRSLLFEMRTALTKQDIVDEPFMMFTFGDGVWKKHYDIDSYTLVYWIWLARCYIPSN